MLNTLKNYPKFWALVFLAVLGFIAILIILIVDPYMIWEHVIFIEVKTNNFYTSLSFPIYFFFIGLVLVSFFLSVVLSFICWPACYLGISVLVWLILFNLVTCKWLIIATIALYLLLGSFITILIQFLNSFLMEWGVPLDKWELFSYDKFKGLVLFSSLVLLSFRKASFIPEVLIFFNGVIFCLIVLVVVFIIRSFFIIDNTECPESSDRSTLPFDNKEFLAIFPFIGVWISYYFLLVPLNVAVATSNVTIVPLLLFFVLTNNTKLKVSYLAIISYLSSKVTFVYTSALFFICTLPITDLPGGWIVPSIVFLIKRCFNIMILYDNQTLVLLQQFLCCKYKTAWQAGEMAFKATVTLIAVNKVIPELTGEVIRRSQQAAQHSEVDFNLKKLSELRASGGLSNQAWQESNEAVMKKQIQRSYTFEQKVSTKHGFNTTTRKS